MAFFLKHPRSIFLVIILISTTTVLVSTLALATAEEFTKEEKVLIKKLRARVSDVITHDYQKRDEYLVTWLRVKNLDLDAAEEMFRESQKWRKDNHIDSIANETILQFNSPPYSLPGTDSEGNPILIFTPTHIDLRRMLIQGQRDKIIRVFWQMSEKAALKRLSSEKARGSISILDLNGFSIRQHLCIPCLPIYTEWFTSLENNYPATIKNFVIINVPRIAIPFIELVRPLLSPVTAKTLKVFPPDKKEWSAYLKQIVPADQLPYRFGGTQEKNDDKS